MRDYPLARRRKRVHHKVRTGCKACKVRHQKCDERKPICAECSRHLTKCVYPTHDKSRSEDLSCTDQTSLAVASASAPTRTLSAVQIPLIPASPSSNLNLTDLELFHQYLMSTCKATAQLPSVTTQIQITMPQLAQAYPFLMHGILAQTAVHLSRLHPLRQSYYATLAAEHHSKALPEFQSMLQSLNKNNSYALMVYSKILVWCSLAGQYPSSQTTNASETRSTWLPQWFYLLRGSCHLARHCSTLGKAGPHVLPLLGTNPDHSSDSAESYIVAMMEQLTLLTDNTLYEQVTLDLRIAFARSLLRRLNTPFRNAINYWIDSLTDEYVELLEKKEPWALIVLAHFCVLLHRSETVWFMKGNAVHLLLLIRTCLDDVYQKLIQWPCQELGVLESY